ncbi:hypothetical protein DW674_08250 [Mitsuokella multacida]|uniref:Uncharacterized protein n=1 Tax=Mitsuokella multacida TaxID=52226 RepID=A0A414NVP8_9FIRM|nr:hypothetical protein DW674_08250 [Mitsuokella multacida]
MTRIRAKDGKGLSNTPHDQLLNLFFAMESILTKELNAFRLNDALWQGFWSAKKQVLDAAGQSSAYGQPFPCFRSIYCLQSIKNARYLERDSRYLAFLRGMRGLDAVERLEVLCELLGVKSSGGIHKWSFSLLRGTLDTPR